MTYSSSSSLSSSTSNADKTSMECLLTSCHCILVSLPCSFFTIFCKQYGQGITLVIRYRPKQFCSNREPAISGYQSCRRLSTCSVIFTRNEAVDFSSKNICSFLEKTSVWYGLFSMFSAKLNVMESEGKHISKTTLFFMSKGSHWSSRKHLRLCLLYVHSPGFPVWISLIRKITVPWWINCSPVCHGCQNGLLFLKLGHISNTSVGKGKRFKTTDKNFWSANILVISLGQNPLGKYVII